MSRREIAMYVVGTLFCGKTTLLETACDIAQFYVPRGGNRYTENVFIGRWAAGQNVVLNLYECQNHNYYLVRKSPIPIIGALLIIDSSQWPDIRQQALSIYQVFETYSELPVFVGDNAYRKPENALNAHTLRDDLSLPDDVPIVRFNAKNRDEARAIVLAATQRFLELEK